MAAWIAVGLVAGVMLGGLVGGWVGWQVRARGQVLENQLATRLQQAMQPRAGDGEMLERVLERLLGAVVPEPREETRAEVPTTQSDAEYEPPAPEVGDWTDPFFALGGERQMVGRLAPGQGVPVGLMDEDDNPVEMWRERGEGAFEEWMRETVLPDEAGVGGNGQVAAGSWVDPVRLEGEE